MTREEFEQIAIQAANRTSRIGHIECPREVKNPGIYFGMMLAAEVLLPLLERMEKDERLPERTPTTA